MSASNKGLQRATISDVANLAGVSIKTVSRVINGEKYVSEKTRQRVLEAVEKAGYKPNLVARSLVLKRSQSIGVIISNDPVHTFANPFYADVLKGIGKVAEDANYQLQFLSSDDDEACVHFVESGQVGGIIFMNIPVDSPLVDTLLEKGIPFVITCRHRHPHSPAVYVDDVTGAELAVNHLLSLGHRRIGMVNGPHQLASSLDRLEGYKRAIARYGVPFDPDLVVYDQRITEEAGLRSGANLLSRAPDVTAIFVFADIMAIGVMRALDRNGLNIPGDVSVVGYDDISMARYLRPPLTTVRHRGVEKGMTACQVLIAMMNGEPGATRQTIIEPELVVRHSTAVVPAHARRAESM